MAEAGPASGQGLVRVTVCASLAPGTAREWQLQLPQGATVGDALNAAGLAPGGDLPELAFGIWGRPVGPEERLCDGDRLECCRPLTVDPKVARRQRFARQGARAAGLFAKRRPGAKPGY